MKNSICAIKLDLKSQELTKNIADIICNAGGFEILQERDPRLPDLLFIELGSDSEQEMAKIESMLQAKEVRDVFLTSKNYDPTVLMRAIRMGAKEFFPQPIQANEVKLALKKIKEKQSGLSQNKDYKLGKIISVFGSKGGVGTTTIAVNLAMGLESIICCLVKTHPGLLASSASMPNSVMVRCKSSFFSRTSCRPLFISSSFTAMIPFGSSDSALFFSNPRRSTAFILAMRTFGLNGLVI